MKRKFIRLIKSLVMFMNYRIHRFLFIDVSSTIENKRAGHPLPPLPIVLQDFYDSYARVSRKPRFRAITILAVCFSFAVSVVGGDLRGLPRGRALDALRLRLTSFSRCVNYRMKNVECDRCLRCILSPLGMFQSIKFRFLFMAKECASLSVDTTSKNRASQK